MAWCHVFFLFSNNGQCVTPNTWWSHKNMQFWYGSHPPLLRNMTEASFSLIAMHSSAHVQQLIPEGTKEPSASRTRDPPCARRAQAHLGLSRRNWTPGLCWRTLSKLLGMRHTVWKQWTGSLLLGGVVVISRNKMNHLSQAGNSHSNLAGLWVAFPRRCRKKCGLQIGTFEE